MQTTCSVDGCDRVRWKARYCRTHYWRLRNHGDPGSAEIRRWVRAPVTCTVDGCDNKTKARGLCSTHWARWHKHGDPGPVGRLTQPLGDLCAYAGCSNRRYTSDGYCPTHRRRVRVHGDVNYRGHGNWRGDDVGYIGVHHRLRRQRGPAKDYSCAHCTRTAVHWAYAHTDSDVRGTLGVKNGALHSIDPSHYLPLCASCHKTLDVMMKDDLT